MENYAILNRAAVGEEKHWKPLLRGIHSHTHIHVYTNAVKAQDMCVNVGNGVFTGKCIYLPGYIL